MCKLFSLHLCTCHCRGLVYKEKRVLAQIADTKQRLPDIILEWVELQGVQQGHLGDRVHFGSLWEYQGSVLIQVMDLAIMYGQLVLDSNVCCRP
jgi:hypothetical protein